VLRLSLRRAESTGTDRTLSGFLQLIRGLVHASDDLRVGAGNRPPFGGHEGELVEAGREHSIATAVAGEAKAYVGFALLPYQVMAVNVPFLTQVLA
jgi:hypothetical protein